MNAQLKPSRVPLAYHSRVNWLNHQVVWTAGPTFGVEDVAINSGDVLSAESLVQYQQPRNFVPAKSLDPKLTNQFSRGILQNVQQNAQRRVLQRPAGYSYHKGKTLLYARRLLEHILSSQLLGVSLRIHSKLPFCRVIQISSWISFLRGKRVSEKYLLIYLSVFSLFHPCFLVCIWILEFERKFRLVSIIHLLLCEFPFSLWRKILSRQESF